ncbi:AraC family transcriptional regulator [Catenovulum sp. 2E275]|uniref:AraC family transcriptional regulator n=1 Tax=Catenovulum sp. 2E275 TaxID=2980497 RepID=UPI0021D11CF7|nr:AraC family transcriptional regulator [Catenovulum sp. 2E275]MCU4677561.1 AraC family transcriptional regulator [Catenovulum sp. 2E275]
MKKEISIKQYSEHIDSHLHSFHQLLIPLNGKIDLVLENQQTKAAAGNCILIKAGVHHEFSAKGIHDFLVVDLDCLPASFDQTEMVKFTLDETAWSFISYIEKQIKNTLDHLLSNKIVDLLCDIIQNQKWNVSIDPRIQRVVTLINNDLSNELNISQLAKSACMSETQFKLIFKQNMKQTPFQYVLQKRMEKAKGLLIENKLPVYLIAESVGFGNASAFTKRFSSYFGYSPTEQTVK